LSGDERILRDKIGLSLNGFVLLSLSYDRASTIVSPRFIVGIAEYRKIFMSRLRVNKKFKKLGSNRLADKLLKIPIGIHRV
jgi:hypothetical protein